LDEGDDLDDGEEMTNSLSLSKGKVITYNCRSLSLSKGRLGECES